MRWVVILLVLVGCGVQMQLTTSDDTVIAYNFIDSGENAVILLHQLNKDKTSYLSFQETLEKEGISSIAIDSRGHGNSEGNWHQFSEEDFRNMLLDAEGAKDFLEEKGKKVVGIVGASIGANTAARFNEKFGIKAVLLSPGLNFRGIDFESTIPNLKDVLIVVSDGDKYSFDSSQKAVKNPNVELKVYEGDAHGTFMFDRTDLDEVIVEFLK